MTIKQTLINLGYEEAGVLIENDTINDVANMAYRWVDLDKRDIGTMFKYCVLLKYLPTAVAGGFDLLDGSHYANHFWKIYPEKSEDSDLML